MVTSVGLAGPNQRVLPKNQSNPFNHIFTINLAVNEYLGGSCYEALLNYNVKLTSRKSGEFLHRQYPVVRGGSKSDNIQKFRGDSENNIKVRVQKGNFPP